MTTAEHILSWAENSQPHWLKLKQVAAPGEFLSERGRAYSALNLATETVCAMLRGGDLARSDYEAADILDAAKLMLSWEISK